MLGQKSRQFKTHPSLTLEELVPARHFYRQLESILDLEFVRDLVTHCYAERGRPSIDPVVFFKLQLIMFFEGIRSERQLMEQVQVNLVYRWYIGYDLDEEVPHHSALSRIRDRYGLVVFQAFFEEMVERCVAAGLVWGQELYFDGTKVRANASSDRLVPRFAWEARQYLQHLAAQIPAEPQAEVGRSLVEKYNGQRLLDSRTQTTQTRQADTHVCPTDPCATPLYSQPGSSRLGYHVHYVVDGGKARVILAALVTPASIMDNTPMLDLARLTRFRWGLHPRLAVADKKYGTVPNVIGLEQDGIRAYLGRPDYRPRHGVFSSEQFRYVREQDHYICPADEVLPNSSYDRQRQVFMYRTSAKICQACHLKPQCTTSTYARIVVRSIHQDILDRVQQYRTTPAYHKAQRKRSVWVEPMFGEAKQWHNLRKFRWRGLLKVNMQALLTAAGQNIKRLLKHSPSHHRPGPLLPNANVLPSHGLISWLPFSTLPCTQFPCLFQHL
jgi:transposase